MNVFMQGKALKAVNAKLEFVRGRGSLTLARGVADAIERGNQRDRLAGKDRYGRPLVPLKSKRTGKYKGATGPVLAPYGTRSRSIAGFRADPKRTSTGYRIVAGWINSVFLAFHAYGAGRLPVRDLFGISPATHAEYRKLVEAFKAQVVRIKG